MMEACAQVHRENDSSFNGVMSDKIRVGPFPWKVETAIKSVSLLTDMESDRDLFEVLLADDEVPPGAEFQIPCVVRIVLVGQEKSHGIEVERKYTTYARGFTPPRGARNHMRHAPPPSAPAPAPAAQAPIPDPYAVFGGYAAFTAFQQWQAHQAAQHAGAQAPPQVGINIAPGGGMPQGPNGVNPAAYRHVVPGAVPPPPPTPPLRNIQQNNSFIGDIRDDMSMSSSEADRQRHQRQVRVLTRNRSENEDPTVHSDVTYV